MGGTARSTQRREWKKEGKENTRHDIIFLEGLDFLGKEREIAGQYAPMVTTPAIQKIYSKESERVVIPCKMNCLRFSLSSPTCRPHPTSNGPYFQAVSPNRPACYTARRMRKGEGGLLSNSIGRYG